VVFFQVVTVTLYVSMVSCQVSLVTEYISVVFFQVAMVTECISIMLLSVFSQRLLVCKSKFVSLQGMKRHGSSFHRAVEQMRTQSWQQLRKPVNDRKKSVAKGNWCV
jgi:hypothetical protein